MKKILAVVLTVILALSFAACGEKNYNYEEINFDEIIKVYKENRARAEEEYIGDYVYVKLEVNDIISKDFFYGSVFDIYEEDGEILKFFDHYIDCFVADEELQKRVLNLKKEEKVVVKGKITEISVNDNVSIYRGPYHYDYISSVTLDLEVYEIQ